ncbi:MAG: aldo/keto reductase [Lentisphaerota bacterium]
MKMQFLSNTGLQVSGLCMGTMTFGREADAAMSAAIFKRCREAGINFFDCANIYAKGQSEVILGGLIRDCRSEVVITSKVYFGEGLKREGLSRQTIMTAAEASLKRLNTDRIDLYFAHHFDEEVPLEESLKAMDDLVRQGKVLHLGASNFAAWQVEKALGISARQGWAGFKCIQPMYNLVKRQAESEILPMAQAEHLAVITYSPLGGGVLTGKYIAKEKPSAGRMLTDTVYQRRYGEDAVQESACRFALFAKERGFHPVSLALAWVAHHPAVTAPIVGARNLEQLENCLNALKISMTPDLYRDLSALSPAPPLATDRNDELPAP